MEDHPIGQLKQADEYDQRISVNRFSLAKTICGKNINSELIKHSLF